MAEKKNSKKKTGLYILGSAALTVGAIISMPKIIDSLSNKMYSQDPFPISEEDDRGPEIVRKEKVKRNKDDGKL